MSSRRYEQGGVVSFIVVTTVLALLLAGGIWYAKQQGKPVAQVAKTDTASQQSSGNGAENKTSSDATGTPSTEATPDQTKSPATPTPTSTPVTAPQPTPTPSSSQVAPQNTTNTGQSTTPVTGTTAQTASPKSTVARTGPSDNPDQLPSTGMSDIMLPLLVSGIVATGAYVYIQSYQRMRVSALK